jgi:hypothetical protein
MLVSLDADAMVAAPIGKLLTSNAVNESVQG